MKAPLIETHAHLDDPRFEPDFEAVLARSHEAGVEKIITIGIDLESSRRTLALVERYPQLYAALGIHPLHAEEASLSYIQELREMLQHPKVVALGEIGVDHYHLPEEKNEEELLAWKAHQQEVFRQQLELAVELGLNVIVHQRAAWEPTLEVLHPFTGRLRAVFHCFGEAPERAALLAEMGHLVSFTGIVTFKNAPLAQATVTSVAPNGYMVETDSPYLAPVPYRGQRAEPCHTRLVAQKIAELRGVSSEEVAAATTATAKEFFRWL